MQYSIKQYNIYTNNFAQQKKHFNTTVSDFVYKE